MGLVQALKNMAFFNKTIIMKLVFFTVNVVEDF